MNNIKKKIRYITTCLLSIVIVLSSFGCTVVVHSCSVSGNSNICINKVNDEKSCNACCDENSETNASSISDNCCTEHSFSTYFYAEVSQTINNVVSCNPLKLPHSLVGHSNIKNYFKLSKGNTQKYYWYYSFLESSTSLLKNICKLQI